MTIELTEIDHVGIAVADLEAAVETTGDCSAWSPSHRERVEDQGVEEVLFAVGSSYIQLLGALGPDTPVGRSLASRGPACTTWRIASTTSRPRSTTCAREGARLDRRRSRGRARGTR